MHVPNTFEIFSKDWIKRLASYRHFQLTGTNTTQIPLNHYCHSLFQVRLPKQPKFNYYYKFCRPVQNWKIRGYFNSKWGWRNASAMTWRSERDSQQNAGRLTRVSSMPSFNCDSRFMRPLYSSLPVSGKDIVRFSSAKEIYSDSSSNCGVAIACSFFSAGRVLVPIKTKS